MRGALLAALLLALGAPASAAAAPFTVQNTNDDGAGSLRQAIADAAASNDGDTITFATGGQGTIELKSGLPQVGDSDAVNAPEPVGGKPLVLLDGGGGAWTDPVLSLGSNVILQNIGVTGARGSAVLVSGKGGVVFGNVLDGNYIGVDVAGDSAAIGGTDDGSGNVIRNNGIGVRGRTTADGVSLTNNVISGNAIGARIAGARAVVGNPGGLDDANVFTANSGNALVLVGNLATGAFIINNVFGTTTAGLDGPAALNGDVPIRFEPDATDNSVFGNQINAGGFPAIFTGPIQRNRVADNDILTSNRFIFDGGTPGTADGLAPAAFGTPFAQGGKTFVPFSVAGRQENAEVEIFLRRARCTGSRIRLTAGKSDSVMTDGNGVASKKVDVTSLGSDPFICTTQDAKGTPDLMNICADQPPPGDGGSGQGAGTPPASEPATTTTTPSQPGFPLPATFVVPSAAPFIPRLPNPLGGLPPRIIGDANGFKLPFFNRGTTPTTDTVFATMIIRAASRAHVAARKKTTGTFALKTVSFTLAPRQHRTVRIAFTAAVKRYVRRKHATRARLKLGVLSTAPGRSQTFTKSLTLKLKKARRPRRPRK